MTHRLFRMPFQKRGRRRPPHGAEEVSRIFRTFVNVLAQMHARSAAAPEKN